MSRADELRRLLAEKSVRSELAALAADPSGGVQFSQLSGSEIQIGARGNE
jgi:hypothetical protein